MRRTRLKELRAGKRLTQAGLAERLGVNQAAVSRWEASGPPAGRLIALCDVLGCSASDLRPDLFPVDGV